MYATVTLRSELDRDAVLIPGEAYIDSGLRRVAFVDAGGGKFQPRDIIGVEAEEGMVEVLYGLDEGETVVTSGQFLIDSESKLQEAVAVSMRDLPQGPPAAAPPAVPPRDAGARAGHASPAAGMCEAAHRSNPRTRASPSNPWCIITERRQMRNMCMTFITSILTAITGAGLTLAVGTATELGSPVKSMPAGASAFYLPNGGAPGRD